MMQPNRTRTSTGAPYYAPSSIRDGAERGIDLPPTITPSTHAIPVIGDALAGELLVSHPERSNAPLDSTGRTV
jgi:hypothetical protein